MAGGIIEMSVSVKGQTSNPQTVKPPPENRTSVCVCVCHVHIGFFRHSQNIQIDGEWRDSPETFYQMICAAHFFWL